MIKSSEAIMNSADDSASRGLTCLVVKDDVMIGEMLSVVLRTFPGIGSVLLAMTVGEAINTLQAEAIDLVILDLRLPDGSGLEVIEAMARLRPQAECIVILAAADEFTCPESLAGRCNAIIDKAASLARLQKAVEASVRQLTGGRGRDLPPHPNPASMLRDRELQIFTLIGRGMSTKQIAQSLGISVHTVNSHRKSIVSKLGVVGTDLVRLATIYTLLPRSNNARNDLSD